MDKRLAVVEAIYNKVRQKYKQLVKHVQKTCPHDYVIEREQFKIAEWLDVHRPIRVCTNCGLTEEGWNYYVLVNCQVVQRVKEADRIAIRYQRGATIFERDEGPLIRNEKTVEQLIDERVR